MIKLLIVDDSAFMRIALRKMVSVCPDIQVVGEAKNGAVAVRMAQELLPDVITMDIEMPEMDGITAAGQIMQAHPCAIIMISSVTTSGANATIKALEKGAVDFIPKQSSLVQLDINQIGELLVNKILFWGKSREPVKKAIFPVNENTIAPVSEPIVKSNDHVFTKNIKLVVVGISTGGPAAMPSVLHNMGVLPCPMVIAQHMPAVFTHSFAEHMRRETGLNVIEGEDGTQLEPGMIVIAPGGTDCVIREPFSGKFTLYHKRCESAVVHPNADVLFQSAASLSVNVAALVMTGMGNDGTQGAKALALKGMPILVQDPQSCVVDGMPGSIIAAGIATEILDLPVIGKRLAQICRR